MNDRLPESPPPTSTWAHKHQPQMEVGVGMGICVGGGVVARSYRRLFDPCLSSLEKIGKQTFIDYEQKIKYV